MMNRRFVMVEVKLLRFFILRFFRSSFFILHSSVLRFYQPQNDEPTIAYC